MRSAALLVVSILMMACSAAPSKKGDNFDDVPSGYGDNSKPLDPPRNPDNVNEDGGAFDLGGRESDGGMNPPTRDDDAGMPMADAGPNNGCMGSVGAGDFKIVEIMIASQSGSGDKGEWIEVQSTRDCTLNAKGIVISSPRGMASDSATITGDAFIPKYGTFVVANSTNGSINHSLPGVVFAFAGDPADVLKNDGDTITIKNGNVTVDTLTYPSFTNLSVAKSVSFPWDCSWSDRSDWSRWSYSFSTYGTSYKGTPNDDNWDVACY
jgi:hypothetical protein